MSCSERDRGIDVGLGVMQARVSVEFYDDVIACECDADCVFGHISSRLEK